MSYSFWSVFKGASIYTIGEVSTKALGFLLIPVYTHYLNPEEYGKIGYLQVILQLLSTILMFGLYGAQTRYIYEFKKEKKKIGEFLFSINCFIIVVLIVVCTLLTFGGKFLYDIFSPQNIAFYPYITIICWIVFFQIIGQLITSYYLATKEYKRCAGLQIVQFVLNTSLILYHIVYLNQGALGKFKGLLFGQAMFCVLFYIPYARKFIPKLNVTHIKYALLFGFPIVFHLLANALHNSFDRIILERFVIISEIGVYTLGYQIGMIITIIVTSINKAWQPNYYDLLSSESNDTAFENRKFFALWLTIVGFFSLLLMLWARELIMILTPEIYFTAANVLPVIILGQFFFGVYLFGVSPFFFFKKTKILPFLTVAAAILNVLLNIILIPFFGIMGAAYATLLSYFFQALLVFFIGSKIYNPSYEISKIILVIFLLLLGLLMKYFPFISWELQIVKILFALGYLIICYIIFREYFDDLFSSLEFGVL